MTPPTDAPTNVDVVVFALAAVGGTERSIHLEAISVKAFELAPGAFRWDLDEYATKIDKDKVRVSLTDAAKSKYGQLVRAVGPKKQGISKPTDVWRLTPAGVEWFLENRDRLSASLGTTQPALKKGRAKRVRDRILSSELYSAFVANGQVKYEPYLFADLVEASPDAAESVMQMRYEELMGQVVLLNDSDFKDFLETAAATHADMLLMKGGFES